MKKKKQVMIDCSICNGTGIQEETMKGYRRYKCWCCNGTKKVPHPFPLTKKNEKEIHKV